MSLVDLQLFCGLSGNAVEVERRRASAGFGPKVPSPPKRRPRRCRFLCCLFLLCCEVRAATCC